MLPPPVQPVKSKTFRTAIDARAKPHEGFAAPGAEPRASPFASFLFITLSRGCPCASFAAVLLISAGGNEGAITALATWNRFVVETKCAERRAIHNVRCRDAQPLTVPMWLTKVRSHNFRGGSFDSTAPMARRVRPGQIAERQRRKKLPANSFTLQVEAWDSQLAR